MSNWQNPNNWYIDLPLDLVSNCVFAVGVNKQTKLASNKILRLRRTGDNQEDNIPSKGLYFSQKQQDLFDEDQNNCVSNSTLTIDSNSDGKADGWTFGVIAGTASYAIDDNAQRVNLLTSPQGSLIYSYQRVNVIPGETISMSIEAKVSGDINVNLLFEFRKKNGDTISTPYSTKVSPGSYTTITLPDITIPAEASYVYVHFRTYPIDTDDTGSAWFKNVNVVMSKQQCYISKWYDQSEYGNDAYQLTVANQLEMDNDISVRGNSSSAYAIVANHSSFEFGSGSFTAEIYYKGYADSNRYNNLLSYGDYDFVQGFLFAQYESYFYAFVNDASVLFNCSSIFDGSYKHIVIVCNSVAHTVKLYVNNALVYTKTNVNWNFTAGKNLYFGKITTNYATGNFKKIKLFSKVLTEDEIGILYKFKDI